MGTSVTRRRPRDEDEDVPRRTRRAVEPDDDAADESPRSRRRSRDDDDDDEPRRPRGEVPSRRSARDDDDEEEPSRGRGGRRTRPTQADDADEDDEPKGQTAKANGGWGAWKKEAAKNFHDDKFKIEDDADEVIIKFLDEEPFHNFQQHWVEGLKGSKRKSFLCLKDLDQTCPLCDAGHDDRSAFAAFNIVRMEEGEEPTLFVWQAGTGIAGDIEKRAAAKTGPLPRHYYAVAKKKAPNNGPVRYSITLVRERDLADYDIEPLTDKEMDALYEKAKDATYFRYPALSELRAIAKDWARADD